MRRLLAVFRRRKPAPETVATFDPAPDEHDAGPDPATQTEGVWQHGKAFGADGWFHPMTYDIHGNETGPDLNRRLVHNTKDECFEFAQPHHRPHKEYWETKHVHGRELELNAGGED